MSDGSSGFEGGFSAGPAVADKPASRAWFVLLVLWFVYVLNFLDRQLLSILAKPIQDELHVSDGQLGLIGGLYFALFYCFISIPVGWLADRTSRVGIISVACALWSAATAACGLAVNYGQLVLARLGVGIGEAGGVPPSYAVISDTFPSRRRGLAFGIYNMGPPIGQALGVAFGASIAAFFSWRIAFIALGIVGVVTALFVRFFVREPRRGAMDKTAHRDHDKAGFFNTLRLFLVRPTLWLTALACGIAQIVTYGSSNFTTLFLMREKGMTLQEIAVWYAAVVAVGMGLSMVVSGRLIDIFAPRSRKAYALIPALGLICALPLFIGFIRAEDWRTALLFLLGPLFFNYFFLSSAVSLVQESVRPNERVLSGAILLLIMNLTGLGLGPTFVGAVSDYVHTSNPQHSLQMAFYALVPFYILAIILFFILAGKLTKDPHLNKGET